MSFKFINPDTLGAPRGYANGVLAEPGGRLLFIAGQVGWDQQQKIVSEDFVKQFDQAMANVLTVVNEAGGSPDRITRLVIYVTNITDYELRTREVGERYRAHMGKHFPAMVLVQVSRLLDPHAKIEIEGMAVL
jgi:enamine deaminase RidA (YjgF/YER057c/UK114 family)